MENINEYLSEITGLSSDAVRKILLSLIIIVVLYLAKLIAYRIVWRQTKDPKARYQWKRIISIALPFIGIILVGSVWIQAFRQFGAFLGLLSAGLALVLKDPLINVAGWFFIFLRNPFGVGDRIQIGEHAGDVIDMRLYQFTILEIGNWVDADQSTGRLIHIPNGKVFTEPQINYSAGFDYIWNELEVRLTFESNWEKARQILQEIADKRAAHIEKQAEKEIFEASKSFMIHFKYLTPYVYTSIKEFGILLTVRYLCNPRKRRGTENEIWTDILSRFKKHNDIKFAYPTTRFYTREENRDGQLFDGS